MRRYIYIGKKPRLQGTTALGLWRRGNFYVQVNDLKHRWAYRWHLTRSTDWRPDPDLTVDAIS